LSSLPPGQWLEDLGATLGGLSSSEAAQRLARYGPNDAMAHRRPSLVLQFLGRFRNPLVLVLLFASSLSAVAGDLTSFVIITIIVLLSVVLDFVQEVRARDAVEKLRRSVALKADVRRDGSWEVVAVERLVPGDVVQLAAGDIVPADGCLLESRNLFVNEALMTGEPYPAEKRPGETAASVIYMGTSVISGTAVMLVCRTGASTALGGLAGALVTRRGTDAFDAGVRRFGLLILRLTMFLVLFALAANVLFHRSPLESLLFALALAVGLTPELLPMVVTVTLAGGAKRLAARRVIVKRLAAIHDLGAMDVLCTDKTGTLTEARIKLVRHIDARGETSERVLELAYLNSVFESGIRSPLDDAILDRGQRDVGAWRKLDEVPFDFERRRVSVLLEGEGARLLVVKGSPEDVLRLSTAVEIEPGSAEPISPATRQSLFQLFEKLGGEGFRVLAIAWRRVGQDHASAAVTDESELSFAGFVAFLDPPKVSAAGAIASLASRGVQVKVLTGDNERVTRHVCDELGFAISGVLTGDELSVLTEEALLARVQGVNLFCRVTPQQKRRILLALKRLGLVTGFLGDGINDASALHTADVGISVDTAADVAKEAADLVLLDHDLAVVQDGVLEGRRTVENVTKYIMMGSSSNFGNMSAWPGRRCSCRSCRCSRSRCCSTTCSTTARRWGCRSTMSTPNPWPGRCAGISC
jgi:Mg2+-importing ATPase